MTALYKFIPFFFILLFWLWPYSLQNVFQKVKEFKIRLVKTVSELSRKSSVKRAPNSRWEADGGYKKSMKGYLI